MCKEVEMAKWINVVESNCTDPSKEKEFNDWYDNVHLPDVLETPGFQAATRYVIREPQDGRGKYMAVYEIETDDFGQTMEARGKLREVQYARGRGSDLISTVSTVAYQTTGHLESK